MSAAVLKSLGCVVDALPSSPPVISLDLVKAHCSVDGTDLDELLEVYLQAAIQWAEDTTKRVLFRRGVVWSLESFPTCGGNAYNQRIVLPLGYTRAIEAIRYTDADGNAVELIGPSSGASPAGDDYQESLGHDTGGLVAPAPGAFWPSVSTQALTPIAISFEAGWDAASVPTPLLHAIMFAVADMLDTRGSADLTTFGKNLATRTALVSPYILVREYDA